MEYGEPNLQNPTCCEIVPFFDIVYPSPLLVSGYRSNNDTEACPSHVTYTSPASFEVWAAEF
jgi:hypothetical protein